MEYAWCLRCIIISIIMQRRADYVIPNKIETQGLEIVEKQRPEKFAKQRRKKVEKLLATNCTTVKVY